MRARYAVFTLALAAAVAFAGCDLLPQRSQGEKLWREHCASCHGLNGSGDTPGYMGQAYADLRDDQWRAGGNDGAMEIVIEEGVFGKMPGYPQLTDEEVRALIDYIHVLRGERISGTTS
ncbi:MAG TPA: cytochrome c [Thermoanaerobaculia bacterium]|nr:cytochrome c [Thermoanaerobaculia bacterium]